MEWLTDFCCCCFWSKLSLFHFNLIQFDLILCDHAQKIDWHWHWTNRTKTATTTQKNSSFKRFSLSTHWYWTFVHNIIWHITEKCRNINSQQFVYRIYAIRSISYYTFVWIYMITAFRIGGKKKNWLILSKFPLYSPVFSWLILSHEHCVNPKK